MSCNYAIRPPMWAVIGMGTGRAGLKVVVILNGRGEETTSLLSGERATIRVRAKFAKASEKPMVGMLIRNRLGVDVYGTNTKVEQMALGDFAAGDVLEIQIRAGLPAEPGGIYADGGDAAQPMGRVRTGLTMR